MPRLVYVYSEDSDEAGVLKALPELAEWNCSSFEIDSRTDSRDFWAARKSINAFAPDVLHVVGHTAARFACLLFVPYIGLRRRPKLIVSQNDRPDPGVMGFMNRRVNRLADTVVTQTDAEAERYRNQGVLPERIHKIPPGGVAPGSGNQGADAVRDWLTVPRSARLVMVAGRFDTDSGMKEAIWAFDILKYAHRDVYLVLIGDGPQDERLRQLSHAIGFDDNRVRFAGSRSNRRVLFALAEVVWITHDRGGVNIAADAMAAGKPVVAFFTPELAEIIEDNVTGRFVASGDKVQLAAVTNELLANPEMAKQMGEAGRTRATTHFALAPMVARFSVIYDKLMTDGPR